MWLHLGSTWKTQDFLLISRWLTSSRLQRPVLPIMWHFEVPGISHGYLFGSSFQFTLEVKPMSIVLHLAETGFGCSTPDSRVHSLKSPHWFSGIHVGIWVMMEFSVQLHNCFSPRNLAWRTKVKFHWQKYFIAISLLIHSASICSVPRLFPALCCHGNLMLTQNNHYSYPSKLRGGTEIDTKWHANECVITHWESTGT